MAQERHRSYIHYRQTFGSSSSLDSSPWVSVRDGLISATQTVSKAGPQPGWKQRIAMCLPATTVLSGVRTQVTADNGGFAYLSRYQTTNPANSVRTETVGCFTDFSITVPDADTFIIKSVENRVIMEMINQISEANTTLKSLVSLGEAGETLRMINRAGKGLREGTHTYLADVERYARTVQPARLIGAISRRWLEFAFGVRPLVNDIDDGVKAIRRIMTTRPPRVLVRASSASAEKKQPVLSTRSIEGYRIDVVSELSNIFSMRLYGAVSIFQKNLDKVQHEFGLTLHEFVPTIWELIPYSFLADYFVNLGAIIEAYSLNTSGVRWLAKGTMSEARLESKALVTPVVPPGWSVKDRFIRHGKPYRYSRQAVTRTPFSTGFLVPSLEFTIPGVGTKWLNISALAAQHSRATQSVRRALRR